MSAEKCPVCGERLIYRMPDGVGSYACGKARLEDCGNAEHLAIERAAEVERLRVVLGRILRVDHAINESDCLAEELQRRLTLAVDLATNALKKT